MHSVYSWEETRNGVYLMSSAPLWSQIYYSSFNQFALTCSESDGAIKRKKERSHLSSHLLGVKTVKRRGGTRSHIASVGAKSMVWCEGVSSQEHRPPTSLQVNFWFVEMCFCVTEKHVAVLPPLITWHSEAAVTKCVWTLDIVHFIYQMALGSWQSLCKN